MFKKIWSFLGLVKRAGKSFLDDNAFKLSASLSYYTVFSIGPMLLIIISLAGFFFGREAVQGQLFGQIQGLVGVGAAKQIQDLISNINQNNNSIWSTIIGVIVLIIGATGVFIEIQDSINYIWSVKAKPKKGLVKLLINRLLSFSVIISMGFILMVSLVVNTLMDIMSERLSRFFDEFSVYFFYIVNVLIILFVITVLFAVIFRVLPDAHIKWKDSIIGAVFTAVLFFLGKSLIGWYMGTSKVGTTFGAAASVVVILTWVYYSSLILYFGAEFTKVYAIERGGGVKPNDTAVFVVKQEARELPEGQRPKKI